MADRRARARALLLAAAKQRAREALAAGGSDAGPRFAPFSPSPLALVARLWELLAEGPAPLEAGDLLVDLGCGDGRWLVTGVERFGCRALGVEIDARLVDRCRMEARRRGLEDRVHVELGDVMAVDISRAKLVIVYAFAEALPGIRDHLKAQLSDHASVLSIGVGTALDFGEMETTDDTWLAVPRPRVDAREVGAHRGPQVVFVRHGGMPMRPSWPLKTIRKLLYTLQATVPASVERAAA